MRERFSSLGKPLEVFPDTLAIGGRQFGWIDPAEIRVRRLLVLSFRQLHTQTLELFDESPDDSLIHVCTARIEFAECSNYVLFDVALPATFPDACPYVAECFLLASLPFIRGALPVACAFLQKRLEPVDSTLQGFEAAWFERVLLLDLSNEGWLAGREGLADLLQPAFQIRCGLSPGGVSFCLTQSIALRSQLLYVLVAECFAEFLSEALIRGFSLGDFLQLVGSVLDALRGRLAPLFSSCLRLLFDLLNLLDLIVEDVL
jgi:hypothetical protein